MCTRYYIASDNSEISEIIEKARSSALIERFLNQYGKAFVSEGEVRPTDLVAVIAMNQKGEKSAFPMKWGYSLPNSKTPVVNARSETASEKPLFREDWKKHRCIIPASYYFEWEHLKTADGKTKTGDKYLFQPAGESTTWLCGLYHLENALPVFTILTKEPSAELARFHDRMPVILPEEMIEQWISPKTVPEDIMQYAINSVLYSRDK